MTPEIALLDQLSLASAPYLAIEGLIFGGDRDFALSTILALVREGKVVIIQSGTEVGVAVIERWGRRTGDSATIAALGSAMVDITEKGLNYFLDH